MNPTATVLRAGFTCGLIELRQSFTGAALFGQLLWPVVTLVAISFLRGRSFGASGFTLGTLVLPGVLGMFVALGGWLLVRSRRPVATKWEAQPQWMGRLDSMSPAPAFVLGAFLPNYAIVVAAVSNVIQAGLPQARAAFVMFLFIVVASAGVGAPLLLIVIRRDDAPAIHQRWRAWLVAHGQALVRDVLEVVAVVLLAKGIVGLVS